MQRTLCLDSLGELDGGTARVVIDAELRKAVEDLDDRGEQDCKERIVEIRVVMKKMDNGLSATHVEAFAKVPRRATKQTICRHAVSRGQSKLLFQQFAPDDPNQTTIDDPGSNHDDSEVTE